MPPPRAPVLRARQVVGTLLGLLLVLSGVGGVGGGASAAAADDREYVALGDSYSSGVGTGEYLLDGTTCQRSVHAYPSLLAADRGWRLRLAACSGATVPHVRRAQLAALRPGTDLVSVSVGGNDAGFARVLTECATPWWLGDCYDAIAQAQVFIRERLPGRLARVLAEIRSASPQARVVVVGYPRIFGGEDCSPGTWFSPSEQERLNATADLLGRVLARAARDGGARLADPLDRFVGHAVCAEAEWVNSLSRPIGESYHPNRAGHLDGYAPLVGRRLAGPAGAAVGGPGLLAEDPQLTTPEPAPAYDDLREREGFRAPDPTTTRAARAARAHDVDLGRWLRRNDVVVEHPRPPHRPVAGCW